MIAENVGLVSIAGASKTRKQAIIAFPRVIGERCKIMDGSKKAQITVIDDNTLEIKLIKEGPIA